MNPRPCRIVVDNNDARAYVPYEVRDLVKQLPVRRWNGPLRCWDIPASSADHLRQILEVAGRHVAMVRLDSATASVSANPVVPLGKGLSAARAAAAAASRRAAVGNAKSPQHAGRSAAVAAAAAAARRKAQQASTVSNSNSVAGLAEARAAANAALRQLDAQLSAQRTESAA